MMTQLALNNPFGFFGTKKKKSSQIKRRSNQDAVIPAQLSFQDYKESGYYLDSISELVKNQSLTPEQIAESRTNAIVEKINSLSHKYDIAEFEIIKSFLLKNRFLIKLLEEIPSKISQYFGDNQRLLLKVSYEPDQSNSSELWVEILTKLPAKESLQILDKFDNDWWFESLDKTDSKLNVTLKFI